MNRSPEVGEALTRRCQDWASETLANEVERLEKANAELVAETHRWSAADKESTRLRDEQRRELLARITELEGAYKFVSDSLRQELLENAKLRSVLEDIVESRNACGCTPVCHCNDNVPALLGWKEATVEAAEIALASS